jgi:hypothetical protein
MNRVQVLLSNPTCAATAWAEADTHNAKAAASQAKAAAAEAKAQAAELRESVAALEDDLAASREAQAQREVGIYRTVYWCAPHHPSQSAPIVATSSTT